MFTKSQIIDIVNDICGHNMLSLDELNRKYGVCISHRRLLTVPEILHIILTKEEEK